MSFNGDPKQQPHDVIFSRKINKEEHSHLVFDSKNTSEANSQKELGIVLIIVLITAYHLSHI